MDKIYYEIIENLQLLIIADSGSVSAFSKKNKICRFNLSKIFNGHQKLSVGLYLRILESLGMLGSGHNFDLYDNFNCCDDMPLDLYLRISCNIITFNALRIVISGGVL